ncbi:MAG: glutathione S-transferase family protein [Myxococcota bacterium]
MSGFMNNGTWYTQETWSDERDGQFKRAPTTFRDVVSAKEGAAYAAEPGRYHLYVSYACPWAHRVLIARALMGLEDVISVSVVHYDMGKDGWVFLPDDDPDATPDHLFGSAYLRDVYLKADSAYSGRVTVPVFWDRERQTIVNNESREIIRFLTDAFRPLAKNPDVDLAPEHLRPAIDAAITSIYEPINNGVYKCGFAGTQAAYEQAFEELFEELDRWEGILGAQRYMAGEVLTEADLCMFTTLVRFDAVYYVHFKCNGRLIMQYPNLSNYLREIYQLPGVKETVHMRHITRHYYRSHTSVNPRRLVPVGPLDLAHLERAHDRGRFA